MDSISLPLSMLNITFLNHIHDAVIITDSVGNVDFLNKTAENCTGWSQTEARGKALDIVFPLHSMKKKNMLEQPLQRGEETFFTEDTLFIAPDGETRKISGKIIPFDYENHGIQGTALIFHTETTSAKQVQEKLIQPLIEAFVEPVSLIDHTVKTVSDRYGSRADGRFCRNSPDGTPQQARRLQLFQWSSPPCIPSPSKH